MKKILIDYIGKIIKEDNIKNIVSFGCGNAENERILKGSAMKKIEYPNVKLGNGKIVCRFCGAERKHRANCRFIVRIAVMASDKYERLSVGDKQKAMDEINELPIKHPYL